MKIECKINIYGTAFAQAPKTN